MTKLLIFAISLGLSMRSPNVGDKFDYEVSTGLETTVTSKMGQTFDSEQWVWYERESGEEYLGVDLKHKWSPVPYMEVSGGFKNREAQDINRLNISSGVIVKKYWRAGLSEVWDHGEPVFSAYAGFKGDHLVTQVNAYIEGLESFNVSYKWPFGDRLKIEPTARYEIDRNKNTFYQMKVNFKLGNK